MSHISANEIRHQFAQAMSAMFRDEVPAYGTLVDMVAAINDTTLNTNPGLAERLKATDGIDRLSDERHGAIRVGTGAELSMLRRMFAVMGMQPVGYYDLSVAGIPVHSTAFRPVSAKALAHNPFRIFTSLLRIDLIDDADLRQIARDLLARRNIFTNRAVALIQQAETAGGLTQAEADEFVTEALETFRWHPNAQVDQPTFEQLLAQHRLIADVVCFKGPHINHLTPRTLDIDRVQTDMPKHGITAKAVVEGPPSRNCPILLRQTSFKALTEAVRFKQGDTWVDGHHTARFGEIEQRGVALTPKGRALYDALLNNVRARVTPAPDGSNADEYTAVLAEEFAAFPDDWASIRAQELGYFHYFPTTSTPVSIQSLEDAITRGLVDFAPLTYEDFLPVSAAGIFQSNLGDDDVATPEGNANQALFEQELGAPVLDPFAHYAELEQRSIETCLTHLAKA
ncbi:MAG: VOC family protein [Pseudomonadota bacterium]